MAEGLRYQVSIKGPGADRMSRAQYDHLVDRHLNGHDTGAWTVNVQIWRKSTELEWEGKSARAERLRQLVRRYLQDGTIRLRAPVGRSQRARRRSHAAD